MKLKPLALENVNVGIGFLVKFGGDECLLAQVMPRQVCAIYLHSGNRLIDPILVSDTKNLTESELRTILGTLPRDKDEIFVKVGDDWRQIVK